MKTGECVMKKMLVVLGLCFIAIPHAHAATFNSFDKAFLNPVAVTALSITSSEHEMKHLPDRLGTLTNLKVLEIACLEDLEDLPKEIGKLVKLEELILNNGNGCRMNVAIPEEIGRLKRLKVLDLYGALDARGPGPGRPLPVKTLPNAIGQLPSLEKLDLGRNGLKALPSQAAQLSKLKNLGLDYNEIHELPSFIGNLKNLRELSLRSNGGVKLPQSLVDLRGLRISMGNNSLKLKDQKILVGRFPGITFSFENEWDDATANEARPGK